jgi:hypothetical protein
MLVLNREYYKAWSAIGDPVPRYWIRLWQDGLHTDTPPEWTFCPLSIPCLSRLWKAFSSVPGSPDWGRPQRRAIRILAFNRRTLPDGLHFPCPTNDTNTLWDAYWQNVEEGVPTYRADLFEEARRVLSPSDILANYVEIRNVTDALLAELLLRGYSEYELFVRAGTGILDPKGQRAQSHAERLQGFLDHLQRGSTSEFVVWTEILRHGQPLSQVMSRRIAGRELSSPLEWQSGMGFVRTGGRAFAVMRCAATHSITASLHHRFACTDELRSRSAKLGLPGLKLAEVSQVSLVLAPDRPSWKHSPRRTTAFRNFGRPYPIIESEAFSAALEAIDDDPEEAIHLLCDAFERQLGSAWPVPAGRSYRRSLRRSLARSLLSAIKETRERWKEDNEARPAWLIGLPVDVPLDFSHLARTIRSSEIHADELLAQRLELVACNNTRYLSSNSIVAWLYLARGIRNREVHSGTWPPDLRSVAWFLGRVLINTFVATFCPPVLERELDNEFGAQLGAAGDTPQMARP